MALFTPGKKVRNKKFEYLPRFYDPRKDKRLKQRMRIKVSTKHRRSPLTLIIFIVLVAMVAYMYFTLG